MNLLLIIDRRFPTDHAFLESVYSRILPEKGYKIICIARTTRKDLGKVVKWNNIDVHLFNINRTPGTLWKMIRNIQIIFHAFRLQQKHKFNIIQVRNWEFGGSVAFLIKLFFPITFFYQRSFPSDANYRDKIKSKKTSFREKLNNYWLIFLHSNIIKKADCIFSISDEMKEKLINKGLKADRIIPIGLAFDTRIVIDENIKNKILFKLGINCQKILLYFGKMDGKRNLEFLIDVFSELKLQDIKLLFLGGERTENERLKAYAKKLNVDKDVIFAGRIERQYVPNYISLSYLSISPIPPFERYLVASPTKIFESLGQGIPVVGNDLPVQKRIIEESEGGICVKYNKMTFADAISFLIKNPSVRNKMAIKAKEYISKKHTYEILADRIDKIYIESSLD